VGYDIHIHRADEWFNSSAARIAREEWLRVVEQSDDLIIDTEWWIGRADGGKECAVVLSGHPEVVLWYDEDDGKIVSKNPGRPGVIRMVEIAKVLNARVQGDEGEFYRPDGTYDWE
jgi:hypothetical protein